MLKIQLFDATGTAAGEPFDYYDTVWCEGQLSENEEDIIEHLQVGETAELEHGWTVKRFE